MGENWDGRAGVGGTWNLQVEGVSTFHPPSGVQCVMCWVVGMAVGMVDRVSGVGRHCLSFRCRRRPRNQSHFRWPEERLSSRKICACSVPFARHV